MNVWWSQTMVQGVGWTLLHFLWQGLAIAALLALGLRLLRSGPAHHRYLAGCAALLLMALAPLVTFQLVLKQDEPPPLPVVEPVVAEAPAPVERVALPARTLPKIVVTATREPRVQKTSWRVEPLMPWLVAAWFAGVCGLSCRLFAGWLQIRRLRNAHAEALAGGWPDKLKELARRLGVNRPLRLLRTACVEVPTVIGWLRPVILLPAACLTGLTTAQLESIIAHELAHIRRHDYLINLLQNAAETLLFYHPAVWWVSRRIREERENCCDDLVVEVCGDRVGYARALATLEELRPASAQLALAAGGAPLLQRIRRVLGQGERSAGRPAWPLAGVLVLLLLAVSAAGLREHRAAAANDGRMAGPVVKRAGNSRAVTPISARNLNGPEDPEIQLNPGQFVVHGTLPDGSSITSVLPLPHFRLRQDVTVTSVSGTNRNGLVDTESYWKPGEFIPQTLRPEDSTFMLGDLPRVGELFQKNLSHQTGLSESNRVLLKRAVKLKNKLDDQLGNETSSDSAETIFFVDASGKTHVLKTAQNNPGSQAGMSNWTLDGSNAVDQASSATNSDRVQANMLVQDGRFYYEAGKYDEAEARFKQALKLDPANVAAAQYVGLILEKRDLNALHKNDIGSANAMLQADQDWKVAQRAGVTNSGSNPFNRTNLIYKGRQNIVSKLDRIRVDAVNYPDLPLKDVLDDLTKIAKNRDPDGKGINFFFSRAPMPQGTNATTVQVSPDIEETRVKISLSDVRLADVLDAITKTSEPAVTYSILDYAVEFSFRGTEPVPLETRTFRVDPNTFIQGLQGVVGKSFGAGGTGGTNGGGGFGGGGVGGGAGGTTGGGLQFVTVEASTAKIQAAVRQYFSAAGVDLSTNNGKVVIFNDRKGTLTVRTTSQDLDVIESVVQTLNSRGGAETNELPPLETRTFRVDLNTFVQELEGATRESLSGVIGGAGSVTVVPGAGTGTNTVGFGVPPGSGMGFAQAESRAKAVQSAICKYFTAAGVDMSTNDGKAVSFIFNDRSGTLTVRATSKDLAIIEGAVQKLNTPVLEVNIKTKFVEITHKAGDTNGYAFGGLRYDPPGGNTNIVWIGTYTNASNSSSPDNQDYYFATRTLKVDGSNVLVTAGPVNQSGTPKTGVITGILTDSQYRSVLQGLEQLNGVDILTAPEVTTESGREAQVQAVDIAEIVNGSGLGRGTGSKTVTSAAVGGAAVPASSPTTSQLRMGPSLDVIPTVSADGFSVNLKLIPSLTEFVGYDNPGPFVPQATPVGDFDAPARPGALGAAPPATMTSATVPALRNPGVGISPQIGNPGQPTLATNLPLPHFRLRQANLDIDVWDSQTAIILFAPISVPGKAKGEPMAKKTLIVFVTATVINPDGTRAHSDEWIPKSGMPPQTGTNSVPKK